MMSKHKSGQMIYICIMKSSVTRWTEAASMSDISSFWDRIRLLNSIFSSVSKNINSAIDGTTM